MPIPSALTAPDPVARPRSVVVQDQVRATVLTDRLVRIEYATDGRFEDRGSLAVANRRFRTVPFEVDARPGRLVVDTGAVRVVVADTAKAFTANTLTARIGHGRGAVDWRYRARDSGNLGGTRRTLDGWSGRFDRQLVDIDADTGDLVYGEWERQELDPGLLSRSGWTVFDDSAGPVFDTGEVGRAGQGRGWPTGRPEGRRQDLYLFAYGDDHKAALRDAAGLFGPQPLPPRYAFGYWCSRYHAYTDRELLGIADRFDEMGVPVDVMVVDMDWHQPGWTGYSWDRRYFPDPTDTLARLHERGLRVALNVHPADGVAPHEDAYEAISEALGRDPAKAKKIRFEITDPEFVDAYFRHLHHPEEDRGVDFWWMDWQQGTTTQVPGLDPLPWLNELHWTDQSERTRDRRPLVFSRWGGLGGGRYPVGFSGDTFSDWASLAFQPEFTASSANVLYGYWSHDIGGHYGPPTTPELYTRWVQFGAYSPILRTHSTKHPNHERRFWEFADPYRASMIGAIHRRYEMVPYVYSECRQGVETGLSLVRPMYHEHPEPDAAYEASGQYHFGGSFIVAPVVEEIGDDQMAPARVWLPKGEWYDTAHGRTIKVRAAAGAWSEGRYLIDEIPVYAVAGAVVPGQRDARRLDAASYEHLTFTAYPGASGRYQLYEDDGTSQRYLEGDSVTLAVHHRTTDRTRSVRLDPARGSYRGWQQRRPVEIRFVHQTPPARVEVDGRDMPVAPAADGGLHADGGAYWWYDAAGASVVVELPEVDLGAGATIRLHRDLTLPPNVGRLLDGYPGLARRLDAIATRTALVSPAHELHPDERLPVDLAQAANRVTRDPARIVEELRRVRREVKRLDAVIEGFGDAWSKAIALPFPDQRQLSVDVLQQARAILASTLDEFG